MHTPTRETDRQVTCVCRLRINEAMYDVCLNITSGPDEPVCQSCIDHGHHLSEKFDPIIKQEAGHART